MTGFSWLNLKKGIKEISSKRLKSVFAISKVDVKLITVISCPKMENTEPIIFSHPRQASDKPPLWLYDNQTFVCNIYLYRWFSDRGSLSQMWNWNSVNLLFSVAALRRKGTAKTSCNCGYCAFSHILNWYKYYFFLYVKDIVGYIHLSPFPKWSRYTP